MNWNACMRVFCVDDDLSILKWLVENVDWEGYNCELVGYTTKSADVLDFLEAETVDLLITDISMPGMSGLELIRAVKRKCPNISVIIISAYSEFQYVKEALKYGVINYLLKPIDTNELYDCLKIAESAHIRQMGNFPNRDMMAFRNSVLHELIKGGIDESRFEMHCEMVGLSVKNQVFRVVVMDMKGEGDSVCTAIIKRFQAWESAGYYCFWDSRMNLIILILGEQDSLEESEKRILGALRKEGCWAPAVCIGKRLISYGQIPESYRACCDFVDAGFLFVGRTIKMDNYPYEKYLTVLRTKFLHLISNALLTNDKESIMRSIQKQVELCVREEEKKKELICIAVMLNRNMKLIYPSREIPIPEDKLENRDSSEEMLEWIADYYEGIVLAERKKNDLYSYVSFALQEIGDHYSDKDLSLQRVADLCGVTKAYLGKLFRMETGEFYNDYLLKTRLNAASALLAETEYNMGKIASTVGFSSQSYFNKVFRKMYNMSPMEYRNCFRHMEL